MKLLSVRLSVRPSVSLSVCLSVRPIILPLRAVVAGLLLWARRPGDIVDCCTAGARQQMRAVSRYQLTSEAEQRLVSFRFAACMANEVSAHRPIVAVVHDAENHLRP